MRVTPYYESDGVKLYHGDCLQVLRTLPADSIDAVVSDPPYGLSFMGKRWDYDVPATEVWAECLRVLKPGGHLLAFAGTRTQHRMAVRIEDAGFEIRDMIAWVYGSGFPKSLDVSKAIDKRGGASVAWFGPWFRRWREDNGVTQKQVAALFPSKTGGLTGCVANWELGFNMPTPEQFNLIRDAFSLPFESVEAAEREVVGVSIGVKAVGKGGHGAAEPGQKKESIEIDITAAATPEAQRWQGWGTALKPALEPITVARKPLSGTVAETVLQYGTGALNVDGCRVGCGERPLISSPPKEGKFSGVFREGSESLGTTSQGRWPANLIHDGSDEATGLFPETGAARQADRGKGIDGATFKHMNGQTSGVRGHNDAGGSAARFFYCAKASKRDRGESNRHPTVKPTALMRYLCKLITPPGGRVLDPFSGSGSTGRGAVLEGFRFVGMELDAEHIKEAKRRILEVQNGWTDEPEDEPIEDLPGQRLLF